MQDLDLDWLPPYTVRKHPWAKYIKLKISESKGLEIVTPFVVRKCSVVAVLKENKLWIEKHLAKLNVSNSRSELVLPDTIHLKAANMIINVYYFPTSSISVSLSQPTPSEFFLTGNTQDKQTCFKHLVKKVKQIARKLLSVELVTLSNTHHLNFNSLSIRNQSTRWGSCSSTKSISLNFKLIFLPPQLMRYVLIHELCHTVHMNHAKSFWDLVARFEPDWQTCKKEISIEKKLIPAWISFS